jgi:hypothetical protein
MQPLLNLCRDVQGYPATSLNLRNIAPLLVSATLAASTIETYTVPLSSANWAVFISCNPAVSVWVAINGAAAVPAGGTLASTTSIRNPPGLKLKGGDVISIITATATTDVGIELFPLD